MASDEEFVETLQQLARLCPRLLKTCYWSGTSPVILEDTHHRQSYDIDLHTFRALRDVRPLGVELRQAFGESFQLLSSPDSLGSGFRGALDLFGGGQIFLDVMASFEAPKKTELMPSRLVPAWRRVTLRRFVVDKLQCVVDRAESRDLVDLWVVLRSSESLQQLARRRFEQLDRILLTERLLHWSEQALERDLEAYPGVDPRLAASGRDLLLGWLHR